MVQKSDFAIKPVEGIKAKRYPPHAYKNIPQHPTTAIFVGTRNSGKSTIIHNLVTVAYKKYFHRIVIMTPNISFDPLYMDLCSGNKIDHADCYAEFDEDILEQIMASQDEKQAEIEEIEANNETLPANERRRVPPLPRILIIIDDSSPMLGESRILKNLAQIGRHKSITTFISTQKYRQINNAVRANAENLIITRLSNNQEVKAIQEEKNIPILGKFIQEMNQKYKYNHAWVDRFDKLHLGFTEKIYN